MFSDHDESRTLNNDDFYRYFWGTDGSNWGLDKQQQKKWLQIIKRGLPTVSSADDIEKLLRYLPEEDKSAVLKNINVLNIIKSTPGHDLSLIFEHLSERDRMQVWEDAGELIVKQGIDTAKDLASILKQIPQDKRIQALEWLEAVRGLVLVGHTRAQESKGFTILDIPLSLEEWTLIFNKTISIGRKEIKISEYLPNVTMGKSPGDTAMDLAAFLKRCPPKHCEVVCKAMEQQIPQYIKNSEDFRIFFDTPEFFSAPDEQRDVVFNSLKPQVVRLVNNSADLINILTPLSVEECGTVCNLVQPQILKIMQSPKEFSYLIQNVQEQHKSIAFNLLRTVLKNELQSYANNRKDSSSPYAYFNFGIFKTWQKKNREANALLATTLAKELETCSMHDLFSHQKTILQKRKQLMIDKEGKFSHDHGINSKELNQLIGVAESLIKAFPELANQPPNGSEDSTPKSSAL